MTSLKTRVTFTLACITLASILAPIQALDYNLGVEGNVPPLQTVMYENFTSSGDAPVGFNRTQWLVLSVVLANGTNVTMIMNGKSRDATGNFTMLDETRIFYNLLTGETNMSLNKYRDLYNFTFVIGANLTANDPITNSSEVRINATETRICRDEVNEPVNRTVNILNFTQTSGSVTYSNVTVYDSITGLLLEVNINWINVSMAFKATRTKFNVVFYTSGVQGAIPPVQWVKYENFSSVGSTAPPDFGKTIWLELSGRSSIGENVTLTMEGAMRNVTDNGTIDLNETRISYNLMTGQTNMSTNPYKDTYNFTFAIAANLTVNDPITNGSRIKINATDTRTILNENDQPTNRTVNILNFTRTSGNITYSNATVYDSISGLLLEMNIRWTNINMSFIATKAKLDARYIEDFTRYFYYAAVITAIVVIVAVVVIKRRRTGYVEVSPEETSTQG
jgi:hypothetical protein